MKRYTMDTTKGELSPWVVMRPDEEGEYILYSEYKAKMEGGKFIHNSECQAKLETFNRDLEVLEGLLRDALNK